MTRGALAWFRMIWTNCVKVIEYWIFFTKIYIKSEVNILKELRCAFGIVEKISEIQI